MRSIGNTTLSLGLLNAPVKIYPATGSEDIEFNLCGPKGEEVEQVYRIVGTDTIVGGRDECGRSYEDHKVDLADIEAIKEESLVDEVDGVPVNLKDVMAIQRFIPVKEIPYERVTNHYYIGPGKGSDQALATIIKAMERKKVAAVTKYCLRGRQGVFVLYVKDGVLNAVRLHFAADLRDPTDEVRVQTTAAKAHVDAAIALIGEYVDDHAGFLDSLDDTLVAKKQALIKQVVAGKPIDRTEVVAPGSGVDLMDALIEQTKKARAKKPKKVAA